MSGRVVSLKSCPRNFDSASCLCKLDFRVAQLLQHRHATAFTDGRLTSLARGSGCAAGPFANAFNLSGFKIENIPDLCNFVVEPLVNPLLQVFVVMVRIGHRRQNLLRGVLHQIRLDLPELNHCKFPSKLLSSNFLIPHFLFKFSRLLFANSYPLLLNLALQCLLFGPLAVDQLLRKCPVLVLHRLVGPSLRPWLPWAGLVACSPALVSALWSVPPPVRHYTVKLVVREARV
mmetsp:Transcript_51574/g.76445  ORF Transcript_51574/g.76445 Transcript_51574/m.76445 type:complete len:232 (+) Transcript_51574:61-756(+)